MPVAPDEANPPLLVNPNRMLPFPVPAQGLQLVPRRRCQDAQLRGGMHLQQFPQRDTLEGTEAPGMLIMEELLGFLRRKAPNHTQSILRVTLYVNYITVGTPAFGGACPDRRSRPCRDLVGEAAGFDLFPAKLPVTLFLPRTCDCSARCAAGFFAKVFRLTDRRFSGTLNIRYICR